MNFINHSKEDLTEIGFTNKLFAVTDCKGNIHLFDDEKQADQYALAQLRKEIWGNSKIPYKRRRFLTQREYALR